MLRAEVRAVARSDTGSRVEQSDPVTGQSIHHPPLAVTCHLTLTAQRLPRYIYFYFTLGKKQLLKEFNNQLLLFIIVCIIFLNTSALHAYGLLLLEI